MAGGIDQISYPSAHATSQLVATDLSAQYGNKIGLDAAVNSTKVANLAIEG